MKGRLITLEGGEGAGKSTLAGLVVRWLEAHGRRVILTREPGGSPLAEAVRNLVLGDWDEGMTAQTEALLMFAARSAHLAHRIRPALERGDDVVCDRFIDASWAYQGAGRGVPPARLEQLQEMVLGSLRPDLTLLFDLDPEVGLARARGRGDANRFEAEDRRFQNRVREAYLARASGEPDRFVVIDANGELDTVQLQVLQCLEDRFG